MPLIRRRAGTRHTSIPSGREYAKTPEQFPRFREDVEKVEPLLRRIATHEVQTTMALNDVVTTILELDA
jgi:hypothetical protein